MRIIPVLVSAWALLIMSLFLPWEGMCKSSSHQQAATSTSTPNSPESRDKSGPTHGPPVPVQNATATETSLGDCQLSAAALQRRYGNDPKMTLVDVRSPQEFAMFHIPGALNIPLYSLRTKSFLQGRRVVLTDQGIGCSLLERSCRELRNMGWEVTVLDGGLAQWKRNGGALEGDEATTADPLRITAKAFSAAQRDARWTVVDVSKEENARQAAAFPGCRSLPFNGDGAAFEKGLLALARELRQEPCLRLLIVDKKGEYPTALEKMVLSAVSGQVFFLQGGHTGYGDFLRKQSLLLQPKAPPGASEKQTGDCP